MIFVALQVHTKGNYWFDSALLQWILQLLQLFLSQCLKPGFPNGAHEPPRGGHGLLQGVRETFLKVKTRVMKVINNSNEHVMAIAANFSPEADSHLVCIQNDHGVYQTQAINRQNKPRKVTGASFMVLNGALKSNSGLTAKSSIVEDGLMVQIRPDMMAALRDTLRNMADFTIPCGAVDVPHPDETVILRWVDDDTSFNSGVKSPVDNRPLEGIESIRIQNTTDFQGHNKIIRWTEVFFIENGGSGDSVSKRHIPEPVDLSRLAENLAIAFCLALSESLQDLITLD
ncbi:hypothetical protein BSL78_29489 [Apostichopus japonicus]|uniref:Smad anchor for receptor activation-like C-terminal domain-containing protein n=1 Tax=Stichopus japonicus TaxID=307972 RepID=A0A2G8JD76_STIJA|nr:hypothetical protein BSL78_29489 [Apostichopus japonicus]